MDIFEAMYTQRSMRYLKPDPVPDDVLAKVLESATQATSPSNWQPWRFVVVRDPEVKRRLSAYYLDSYEQIPRQEPDERTAISKGVEYLARHLEEVPVLIMVCLAEDDGLDHSRGAIRYSAIYPAVQNLMLAARALGLGSLITTLHKRHDDKVKELLGIPEGVQTICLIPLGYAARPFGPLRRRPWTEVTYLDRWGAPAAPVP